MLVWCRAPCGVSRGDHAVCGHVRDGGPNSAHAPACGARQVAMAGVEAVACVRSNGFNLPSVDYCFLRPPSQLATGQERKHDRHHRVVTILG